MIEEYVAAFALTLARVGTFLHVLPLLGGASVPRLVKIGAAMTLTLFFFDESAAPPLASGTIGWLTLGLALCREVCLGGLLGFAFSLLLAPARIAGEFIAQEGGLTFANVVSAAGEGAASPFAILFEMFASLVFFSLDLHHYFLLTLHETFHHCPIGRDFHMPRWNISAGVAAAQEAGLLLAAPLALCLFLTTVVLALLTRAAPSLNLYSVGFPMRVLVSLTGLFLLIPQLLLGILGLFSHMLQFLRLGG